MSDLPDLQARAGDLERAITETDDRHGGLLSGLERGLSQLRERLVGATAANDRLARENAELTSPLKKASLTGFHATAKHIAAKAVSPSSETMRTI